jgi:hypothetical protein
MHRSITLRLAMVAAALMLVAVGSRPAFSQDEKTPAWAQVLTKDAQVLVTWGAVVDATGYTVSRRVVGEAADKNVIVNAQPIKETSLVDANLKNGTSYIYSIQASFADGSKGDPKEAVGTPNAPITLAGRPFQLYDIETINPGTAVVAGNVLTIRGAGADIWADADGHAFLATPISGDFTITMKLNEKPVVEQEDDGYGKVGLQVKYRTEPDSPYGLVFASVERTPEYMFEGRREPGGGDTFSGGLVDFEQAVFPAWLRLQRKGNEFTASYSTDGTTFTVLDPPGPQAYDSAPAEVYVGIGATAHNDENYVVGKIDVPSITITTP